MARIGVRLESGPHLIPGQLTELAKLAESRGFESVWLPEGAGSEALTHLAAFACNTSRVTLATGILPIYHRTPTLLAMGAGSVDAISGGRFILGLGVGHQAPVEGGHGIPFDRPMTRMRETVHIVRALLTGEPVTYDGKVYRPRESKLGFNPLRRDLPIYLAALRPQMIEMAGEVADGVLLNWATAEYLEQAVGSLRRGAEKAGRDPSTIDVACYVRTAVVDDVEAAKPWLRRRIAYYFTMDYYVRYFEQRGFAGEAAAISAALSEGDQDAAAGAVTDAMLDELAVVGSAEDCRKKIDSLRATGLRMPIVAPFVQGDDAMAPFRAVIEAFAQ
jgi:probable F420-dependent oxidoreductase